MHDPTIRDKIDHYIPCAAALIVAVWNRDGQGGLD